MRPCASTILRRLVPSPGCGPARARSCAGWCPPPDAALREHDLAQVGALPRMRPGRRQSPANSPTARSAAAAGLQDVGCDSEAVETAMTRLRAALGHPGLVRTVVKRGYRLAYDQ